MVPEPVTVDIGSGAVVEISLTLVETILGSAPSGGTVLAGSIGASDTVLVFELGAASPIFFEAVSASIKSGSVIVFDFPNVAVGYMAGAGIDIVGFLWPITCGGYCVTFDNSPGIATDRFFFYGPGEGPLGSMLGPLADEATPGAPASIEFQITAQVPGNPGGTTSCPKPIATRHRRAGAEPTSGCRRWHPGLAVELAAEVTQLLAPGEHASAIGFR